MPALSIPEIAAALHGLSRLARLDAEGFEYFDASAEGLLKSFWVAAALLPIYILHLALDLLILDVGDVVPPARYLAVELIAYVIDWTALPVVLLALAPILGVQTRVFRFLVPLNWVQLPIGLVILPLGMIARLQVIPADAAGAVGLMIILASLVITGLLARNGLEAPWGTAVGVTMLGFTLSLFINAIAFSMTG